jgi:AcrR family transcriptional regulator
MSAEKQPYHHGDLRETLLVAAERALEELPLYEVTLREIARRAGVSHAAPKHHFASLGAMLAEVAARGFADFYDTIDGATHRSTDQSPQARLTAMIRAYLRFATNSPGIYGLMFGKREHMVATTPNLAKNMLMAWDQLETQVAAVVGPTQAPLGAATVWSAVHGLAMLRLDRKFPPQIDPEQALEALTRTLVAGLRAEA